MRGNDTSCYLGVLGGTMRLRLLISRLQVRLLCGSVSKFPLFANILSLRHYKYKNVRITE